MQTAIINTQLDQEEITPSEYAEKAAIEFAQLTTKEQKKELGQFFTPRTVALYMASLFSHKGKNLKILDPGAGNGMLSVSLLEHFAQSGHSEKEIDLTVYEIDKSILHLLDSVLIHTQEWLIKRNITLNYQIKNKDFILDNAHKVSDKLTLFYEDNETEHYDFIICNPPYFKLQKNDIRAKASQDIVHGQPNIYALFMYESAKLLKKDGELVFITPRSFTSGPYFRVFREEFSRISF